MVPALVVLLAASWLLIIVLVVLLLWLSRLINQHARKQQEKLRQVERGQRRTSAMLVALVDAQARTAEPPLRLVEPPWERQEP